MKNSLLRSDVEERHIDIYLGSGGLRVTQSYNLCLTFHIHATKYVSHSSQKHLLRLADNHGMFHL